MITSFAGYARMLESRITALEAANAGQDIDAHSDGGSSESTPAETAKDNRSVIEEGGVDVVMEAKFFRLEDELLPKGDLVDRSNERGYFQSDDDPDQIIRVLYLPVDGIDPANLHKKRPNPQDIDMISVAVMSKPIASFFVERLGMPLKDKITLRITKPFRPLLQNIGALRGQLLRLERVYSPGNQP